MESTTGYIFSPLLAFPGIDTRYKGPTAFSLSSERHWQSGVKEIAKVSKRQWDSNPRPLDRQSHGVTKANINQAESLGTLPMLIGWNGLLLVDTSATDRPVAKHPFSYLNTCKCHFFRIAIKAHKKIVMTPNCSQCAISRLKM